MIEIYLLEITLVSGNEEKGKTVECWKDANTDVRLLHLTQPVANITCTHSTNNITTHSTYKINPY